MHKLMLLGSAALSGLAMFAPEGVGGGGAVAVQLQSYDPNLAGYISPDAVTFLPITMADAVLKAAPVKVADMQSAAVAEALAPSTQVMAQEVTDADRLQSLTNRVTQLETNIAELMDRDSKANAILAWAEKVLNKYHSNDGDRPAVDEVAAALGDN